MRKPHVDRRPFIIGLSLTLLLFLALCFLSRDLGRYTVAIVTPVFAGISYYFLKKMPFSSVHRRAVLFVSLTVAVLYTAALLLLGLRFGFFLADVALSFRSLLTYVLPLALAIISSEIIRGAFLGQKGWLPWTFAFVIGVLAEMLLTTTFASVTAFSRFMDLVGMALLPALAAQPLYQYTGKHYGIAPAIAYRMIVSLSPYLIPIKSGVPDSLVAFSSLLVPLALLFLIRLLYGRTVKHTKHKRGGVGMAVTVAVVLVFLSSVIMLISNQFRYRFIVIATESMTGSIDKGDAVIYEDFKGQFVEEGDVIVFLLNDRVTVHRVMEITYIDGEKRYFTKGDANDDWDNGFVTDELVLGVVKAKLPYFGYPTLWLRGLFE